MSRPRGCLTVACIPCLRRNELNTAVSAAEGGRHSIDGNGLSGIRLTLHPIPFNILHNLTAFGKEEFIPFISMYSKVTCLPVLRE